jgi:predicted DnaQ family exonuclease/DinG family helicase
VTIEKSDIEAVLGNGGSLSALLVGFEERREQLEMASAVLDALEGGKVLLAEAGTGTGKSLAYLVPLALWAATNGKRAVVSTHTKNLQAQLFEKDLPLLERALPVRFRYSLLKGRQNYICRERLEDALASRGILVPDAVAEKLLPLIEWTRTTTTGDITENTAFDPQADADLWEKVNCDSRYCSLKNLPRNCFLSHARETARLSHLVVVNHALLLTDIAMERAILGDYDCLVIDEAHNLEKVASEQLGRNVSFQEFHQFFERHFRKDAGASGLAGVLTQLGAGKSERGRRLLKELSEKVKDCRKEVHGFFTGLLDTAGARGSDAAYSLRRRYRPGDEISSLLQERAVEPLDSLSRLLSLMILLREEIGEDGGNIREKDRPLVAEIDAAVGELKEKIGTFAFLTGALRDDWVYWMQGSGQAALASSLALKAAPIEVAPLLREMIYDRTESVVLSSATISVGGDFSFTSRRLGTDLIEQERLVTFSGGTSFPLESQVLLLLPTFVPSVVDTDFMISLPGLLLSAVRAVKGGSLILFTSKEWLRETHAVLKELLAKEGVSSVAQDEDGSRESLLDQFRRGEKRVLLGTDSFWEGIDVPGEALELVVIVRLPFPVPTDPITEAVSEMISREGGDSFVEYSLPRTAIRLRQGFGRLVRTREDRGAVLVLDKRIAEKRYGAYLLGALPVAPQYVDDARDIPLILERWCGAGGHEKTQGPRPRRSLKRR